MNGDRAIARITHTGAWGAQRLRSPKSSDAPTLRSSASSISAAAGMYVIPHDERLTEWIEIPEDMAIPDTANGMPVDRIGPKPIEISDISQLDGMIVNAEFSNTADAKAAGRPGDRDSGSPDDFGIDVEIVIRKHHLPHRFPAEVIEQAQSIPGVITRGTRGPARFPRTADRDDRRRNGARFRRCRAGWTGCRTATTRCRSTSPT